MKALAVSIPTFKRPELLERCLEALAKQCITRGVEIYVFDDSCSDINRKVYEKLVPIYPNIQVNINARNFGIDKNIDQCITVPQSSYVWVIGEDDLVENGAIDLILERIESIHPEYMFVNYQYISNDYKRRLDVAIPEMIDQTYAAGVFFEKNGWENCPQLDIFFGKSTSFLDKVHLFWWTHIFFGRTDMSCALFFSRIEPSPPRFFFFRFFFFQNCHR